MQNYEGGKRYESRKDAGERRSYKIPSECEYLKRFESSKNFSLDYCTKPNYEKQFKPCSPEYRRRCFSRVVEKE